MLLSLIVASFSKEGFSRRGNILHLSKDVVLVQVHVLWVCLFIA